MSDVCLNFSCIRVDKERTDYEESAIVQPLFTDNEVEDFDIFEVRYCICTSSEIVRFGKLPAALDYVKTL